MEPETNTLTPDVNIKKRGNGFLYVIFGFLLAIIIGLVVVIIVVNVRNNKGSIAADEAAENGTSTNAEALAASGWTNANALAEYNTYKEDLSAATAKAQEILATDPTKTEEVYSIFRPAIETSLQKGNVTHAYEYLNALVDVFKNNDLKDAALNAFTEIDLSGFPGSTRFNIYRRATDLAEEFGNAEKKDFFANKAAENYDAWEKTTRIIEENNNNRESRVRKQIAEEEAKKQMQNNQEGN